ncbi:hypothetical protein G4B88_012314 [Cannabis sativa]|uniref:Secreted protein n=1 Tax=Cannabis sativa TaxID=3483 RepID=A0A7J6I675_CANSA|nr:hypothetical protein G4B88_012314 [Cannabis sativa]
MAMPWGMTLWMTKMVWLALSGWVSSCLIVADEIATSFRTDYIILTTIPIFTDPKLWFAECQTNMKSVQSLSKCPNCDGSD